MKNCMDLIGAIRNFWLNFFGSFASQQGVLPQSLVEKNRLSANFQLKSLPNISEGFF